MNWKSRFSQPVLLLLVSRWEKYPHRLWLLSALWLALLAGISVWLRLGSTGLLDETEPLFAEAARQMTVTGDWITPYFNEATRFDKPPLIYWLTAIAYQVVGVNEWAARFASAFAATGLAIFTLVTLRRFGLPRPAIQQSASSASADVTEPSRPTALWLSAWIGAALVVLNVQTIAWARIGVSDMLLNGCIGSALLAFFWGYAQPNQPQAQNRWYLAFYILSALAVLAKGPVGIVLPGLVILAFLLYTGTWRSVLQEMQLVRGSLVFLAIALPWYGLVIWANGADYIESFFGYHNVERFTRVVNNHSAPVWFYFAVVPLAFLPWSAYLPIAIARLRIWQLQRWRQQPRSTHLGLFALLWFAVIFGFFTIAVTKLPSYTIPLLPAAAILVGLFWSDQMTRPPGPRSKQSLSRGVWISHIANLGLILLLAAVVFYSPNWMGNEPEMPQLAELVRQSRITLWGSLIWLAVAFVELGLLLRRQSRWIWSVQLIGFLAFLLITLLPAMTIVDAQRQLPLRQLAATIVQVQQPEEPILMIGLRKPSLVFYTQRPITFVAALSDVPDQLRKLTRRLSRPRSKVRSLLLIGRPVKFEDAGITPDQYDTIADAGVFRLARITVPRRS
ncbi:MAG: ArnT family glycosyltransferase [Leptolyngbya sp. IPPAS B-1204]|nr:MAG: glycosyltransferase family 39 protein [Leptolyngbya sp. IPPAS B-1204]